MYTEILFLLFVTNHFCLCDKLPNFYVAKKAVSGSSCAKRAPLVILPVFINILRYPSIKGSENELTRPDHKLCSRYIAVILNMVLGGTRGSIAGVTYIDEIDFEQRYRNVHECDPFYWHPLHLPEDCADMYEQLIRSRLSERSPVRVVKEKINPYYSYNYPDTLYHIQSPYHQYPSLIQIPMEIKRARHLTPYEKMLESVRIDVKNQPSFPSIQHTPIFGPVAMYHQPISKKSVMMIKELSMTYGGAAGEASKYDYSKSSHYDRTGTANKKGHNNWASLVKKALQGGWSKTEKGDLVTLMKNKPSN